MSLAVVHLYGNLGRDAELRYTQSGNPVLRFSVACSTIQGSGDARQEHTDWYNVSLFGKRGETIAAYLTKGSRVAVVGRLQHRGYTRQDGTPGCSLDVVASDIDFAGGARPTSDEEPGNVVMHPAAQTANLPEDEDVPF